MEQRDPQSFCELSDSEFTGWALKLRHLPCLHFPNQQQLTSGIRLTDNMLSQEQGKIGTQVVLDVPEDANRQAEKLTVTTERDISDVLLETVTRTFSPFPVNPNRSVMDQNVETYKELHADLVMTHSGQIMAICDGRLVDHDPDPVSLLQRVPTQHTDKVVLRRKVETVPERELHFRHS